MPDAKKGSLERKKRARRRKEDGERKQLTEVRRQMKARTLDRAKQVARRRRQTG